MNREEARQYLKGRNLSDVLTKDLKIPKDSFMVVRKGETLKGTLDGRTEEATINNEDFASIDKMIQDYASRHGGKLPTGLTGSNNGTYAASNGQELIITKNQEIINELERQLDFKSSGLYVPYSNGHRPLDPQKNKEWELVCHRSNIENLERLQGRKEPTPRLKPLETKEPPLTTAQKMAGIQINRGNDK